MNDYKIPWDELSGEKNLKGTYKVTFLVDISDDDQMSIDDLRQSIAYSVEGDPVLNKISRLDLEKTDKAGQAIPTMGAFKVGDMVIVTEDVEVTAKVEDYNGRLIVGAKNLVTEAVGDGILIVPAGSKARINKIEENNVELIDFEGTVSASLQNAETSEISDVSVNIDSIIFSNKYIAPVTEEDDKLWP
jgi:hypothetical protein